MTYTYLCIIHNSKKVETIKCTSSDKWIKNDLRFSKKKKWTNDPCYHKDEPQTYYARFKKPDTKDQILYDLTYMKCKSKSIKEKADE